MRATEVRLTAAGIDGARTDARLLVGLVTGLDRTGVLTERGRQLSEDELDRLEALEARRLCHEPMSRIAGQREFWSMTFSLDTDVLDPRPDSETLIEAALDHLPDTERAYRLLDLGTGSGCLLLALLTERTAAWGVGVDLAEGAVRTANANARSLGLADRTTLMVGCWSDAIAGRFDLVICNPPYIATSDRSVLAPEVRDYDPGLALFAGSDGLDAYRLIARGVRSILAPEGVAVFEVGIGQAEAVTGLMAKKGLEAVSIRSDLAGIARALVFRPAN